MIEYRANNVPQGNNTSTKRRNKKVFTKLIEKVKSQPKTIVFTEGTDARIQEAASRLLAEKLMGVILVGKVDEVNAAAKDGGFDITGAEILDPETYEGMQEMIDTMVELRKGKMTPEECKNNLLKGNYFGTMLVKMGKADCLLGGATYSTADTIRPALQLVKTKPGSHLVGSCFILNREGGDENLRTIAMGDCAVNIDYKDDLDKDGNVKFSGAQKLAEVAVEAFMSFIAMNNISAPLALYELVFPAFFTNKIVSCFVVNSFSGRYFFAANFTFDCIHTYESLRTRS